MSFFHHVFSLFYEATSSSDFFIQLIQKLICCVVGVFSHLFYIFVTILFIKDCIISAVKNLLIIKLYIN